MKQLITILIVIFTFISCNTSDKSKKNTYFGGQIINPKSNNIILMKDEKVLDTLWLNSDNSFLAEFDSISEGLYTFKHGSYKKGFEFQYVYIEPTDSIIIRLNTWDFDESLVFNGIGAEKNNFLISSFLKNEKDNYNFHLFSDFKSAVFEKKLDSVQKINLGQYTQLKNSEIELSEGFEKLADVSVNYPIYRRKEMYPYIHKNRIHLDSFPEVSKSYYDYRKDINLNNESLLSFFTYHNYVSSQLYNLAYSKNYSDEENNLTTNLLNTIIEKITIEKFKNELLYQAIYNDFRENQTSCSINKKALEIFIANSTDKYQIDRIQKLAADCESIKAQKPLENFELISLNNSRTNIKSVIKNKKTVIYFWSPEMMSQDILIKRVKKLQKNHPSLLFVGINIHPNKDSKVNKALENQYILTEHSSAKKYITSLQPRTILINDDGIISNSFTFLSSPFLERQLKKLESKKRLISNFTS